jgi:hypothetical protein
MAQRRKTQESGYAGQGCTFLLLWAETAVIVTGLSDDAGAGLLGGLVVTVALAWLVGARTKDGREPTTEAPRRRQHIPDEVMGEATRRRGVAEEARIAVYRWIRGSRRERVEPLPVESAHHLCEQLSRR